MSEIAKKLSVGHVDATFLELHSQDQSRMNQGYSLHNLYLIKDGASVDYYLEPTLTRKIKTKHYNCYEESYMEQTNCLNHFYMSKLNCTFPWLSLIHI